MLNFVFHDSFPRSRNLKPSILLYHRIAKSRTDPYLLSVEENNFNKHIKWLKSNFCLIKVSDLVHKISNGRLNGRELSITFDDGYADNFLKALPIIEKYKVPITLFVTAGNVKTQKLFFWDKETKLPDRGRPLTRTQLISLSRSNLVEIGSHTISHPHLSKLNLAKQADEIRRSKTSIEKIINKKVLGFSYPFGTKDDYGKGTVNLVKKAGYQYACSNFPGLITKDTNYFELPRFIVRNWALREFKARITKFYEDNSN
jgi:peptidoglycan/xylan/chitin deacetylase (PgdA/CDA1 family)